MTLLQIFSRRWIVATLIVIAGAALCARLGIWQLDRLQQRRAANAHYVAMESLAALSLPRDSKQDWADMEYRSVVASGHYDFSQQVALRNQAYHDQYGYHLLTPLVLDDGTAILVDRGWIPPENDSSAWSAYDEPAEATVAGIARLSRDRADLGGQADPELASGQTRLDLWAFPNVPRIQEQVSYQLLPVYIQLNPDGNDTQPPIPYQPEVDLSEGPHQSYAMQWFSFAALLLVGYPFYVRQHSARGTDRPTALEET
jgi:surfeit locus 1 family protein